jgi:hypothetical protein
MAEAGGGGGNNQPKPFHKLVAQKGMIDAINYAFGKVTTYKNHRIRVLKQVGAGPFRLLKFAKTDADTGKFRVTIKQKGDKTNCFRSRRPCNCEMQPEDEGDRMYPAVVT